MAVRMMVELQVRGRRQVVRHQPSKLTFVGSSPIARSLINKHQLSGWGQRMLIYNEQHIKQCFSPGY